MEHYKISKLLNDSTVSKFVTKKWVEVNDLSGGQYSVNKNRRFKTSMLRSDLCNYSCCCKQNDKADRNVAFKNNAPFRSCILKINSTLIDNAEYLDIVMSMYRI